MLCVYLLLVICSAHLGRAEDSFNFDHAFRKFQNYLETKEATAAPEVVGNEWYDELVDRMGLAMGEDEEEEESMELMKLVDGEDKKGLAHHQFLRNIPGQQNRSI